MRTQQSALHNINGGMNLHINNVKGITACIQF